MLVRKGMLAVLGLAAVTLASGAAQAVVLVDECDDVCGSNCELDKDLTCCADASCDGEGPIVLGSGADLDMRGKSITCGEATACSYAAVQINNSGSVVQNLTSDLSEIVGPFTAAVDCAGQSGSTVKGIRIDGTDDGLKSCAKVEQNVLIGDGSGTAVIRTQSGVAADFVRDNYIEGWSAAITTTALSPNVNINHNLIMLGNDSAAGISLSGSGASSTVVEDNLIMGVGRQNAADVVISGASGFTYSRNYCDPEHLDCGDCTTNNLCTDPAPPFDLP